MTKPKTYPACRFMFFRIFPALFANLSSNSALGKKTPGPLSPSTSRRTLPSGAGDPRRAARASARPRTAVRQRVRPRLSRVVVRSGLSVRSRSARRQSARVPPVARARPSRRRAHPPRARATPSPARAPAFPAPRFSRGRRGTAPPPRGARARHRRGVGGAPRGRAPRRRRRRGPRRGGDDRPRRAFPPAWRPRRGSATPRSTANDDPRARRCPRWPSARTRRT